MYIAYRVQKILEEAIADAVDESADRYGLRLASRIKKPRELAKSLGFYFARASVRCHVSNVLDKK